MFHVARKMTVAVQETISRIKEQVLKQFITMAMARSLFIIKKTCSFRLLFCRAEVRYEIFGKLDPHDLLTFGGQIMAIFGVNKDLLQVSLFLDQ